MKGSVMIMDFGSRDLPEDYLRNEPYIIEKVWADIKVEPLNMLIVNGEKVARI